MPKISVFCCGVQKGGTTSLFAHLSEHPSLDAPRIKELHIFDNESIDWSQPVDSFADDFFLHAPASARLRFEVTPIYLFWPNALQRLQRYNSAAKIICLFRDPFERAFSHWCMEYARNDETMTFSDAIRSGRNRLHDPETADFALRHFSYVERGFYGKQVRTLYSLFPREQILFLRSEDLRSNPEETLKAISVFLGIGDFPTALPKSEHLRRKIAYPSVPNLQDLGFISDIVSDDLLDFSRLTDIDISQWPTVKRNW